MVFPKDTGEIFQKDSFWSVKGLVLECKRTPFELQKDSFWNAKGLLFKC